MCRTEKVTRGDEEFPALLLTDSGIHALTLYLKNTTAEERELLLTGCLMNHYAAERRRKPEVNPMEKIKMPHPIAELDGDEMTHVLWGKIKEQLILPFVELNTEYYDLGLPNRERTADQVTRDAAEAMRPPHRRRVSTITPNLQRQEEYGLSQLWKSPNATIRAALDGTVFRAPVLISRVKPVG